MKKINKFAFVLTIVLSIFYILNNNYAQTSIKNAFPNLTFASPIDIQQANDSSNRLFIVSQSGLIHVIENSSTVSESVIFLDISAKTNFGGEQGLLGLTFHPNYSSNGFFFVNYTTTNPRRTIISKFSVSSTNINKADTMSETIILEINQPYSNHNGGQIAFGPDSLLYISLGDGGSGGDPQNYSQNLTSLLGKIVRIDVDRIENEKNYSIPADNPYFGNTEGFRDEIFAHGLRNVWKFSFDSQNRLWAADVGQNAWEEINLIQKGGNYGWRIMEGAHCYNPSSNCDRTNLILPVWEYGHNSSGGYSVTGGYYYEGQDPSELNNHYIYADFITGNIWKFNPANNTNSFITKFNGRISTFGYDNNDNLYFADYGSGSIYKFVDESINSVRTQISKNFILNQNYPNPFNPTTTISYSIPEESFSNLRLTKLEIYDTMGKLIKNIISEFQHPGYYEIVIDAGDLASGVYYLSLTHGELISTKKMILLK